MNFKKILAILLATILCVSALAACTNDSVEDEITSTPSSSESGSENKTETVERFDYFDHDMTKYIAVDRSSYEGFKLELEHYLESSEAGVKAYIDMLREVNKVATDNKIVDRPVVKGDVVMLYYKGYKDGVAFAGGSNMEDASPYALEIGSGSFIPGFEDALIGVIPSETSKDNLKSISLTFPEDYHSADLAGQAVVFDIYIEYIVDYAPAEYTEEFITKTLKYTTTDTDVKASFEKYLKDELLPSLRRQEALDKIWNELFENAVVKEYPQSELDYYYESYIDQYKYYKQYYEYFGYKFESLDEFVWAYLGLEKGSDWKTDTKEQCKIDVMQNLLFHAIAQQENIIITQTDYQNSLDYYVEYYKSNGQEKTAAEVEKEVGSRLIKEYALFEKVNSLLFEACEITFKAAEVETETEPETETEAETETKNETESETLTETPGEE